MLDYTSVPRYFAHCMAENCPQKETCLRRKVYEFLPADLNSSIVFINPKSVPWQEGDCPHFLRAEKLRYAKGMRHILDNIPHSKVSRIRNRMINYFGRSTYYRCLRGERLMLPKEQKYIKSLFEDEGFTDELLFDEYVERYSFD